MLIDNHRPPVGRYAPSPTGRLHLGNLRTALAAWQDIQERGGTFLLRMDDTDTPRNASGAEASIIQDLQWLGINWNPADTPTGYYRQSERHSIYQDALFELAARGLIYACTCSRKSIESSASAPHGPDGPIYPGTCRHNLPPEQIQEFLHGFLSTPWQQRQASLRIRTDRLPAGTFHDEIHGTISTDLATSCGDFVILRRDGLWAYQFVCAVDDALMGITRVVRGDDLLSSTARQAAIIQALGYAPPLYRHIPLVQDEQGNRMSKRDGSCGLSQLLQQRDFTPEQARHHILSL